MGSREFTVRKLFKNTFKWYQFSHTNKNWSTCPQSIVSRIYKVVDNINLPIFDNCDYKDGFQNAANSFIKEITSIAKSHLLDSPIGSLFPWDDFSSHEMFVALIMAKRRAKRKYHRINHDAIKELCEVISSLYPEKFCFQYINNRIINKSDNIDPDTLSDHDCQCCDCSVGPLPEPDSNSAQTQEIETEVISNLPTPIPPQHRTTRGKPRREESTPKPNKVVPVKSGDSSYSPTLHNSTDFATSINDSGYSTFTEAPPTYSDTKTDDCG